MNQYPDYVQSNIKWAQRIPSSWKTSRVKYVSECLDGKRVPLNAEQRGELPGDYPYWGANGVVDTVGEYIFDEPLVLVGEDGAPFFDKLKDVAFNVDGKIWVNNHAHILRPKSIDGRFLKYVLNSTSYELYINGSTRDKLTQFELNNIEFPLPTAEEQIFICNFLDRECERISGLVKEKQRFIELLKEKRQALISHFVTKGLDANVPMKDSGVEWIGEVPEHWSDMKLAWAIKISSGENLDNSLFEKDKSGSKVIPVIGGNGVTGYTDKVNNDGLTLVIGRVGAHCGNVRVIDYPSWITDNALRATIDEEKITYAYLAHLLVAANLNDMANKSAQPLITGGQVKSLRFPIPPVKEQLEIVSSITSKNRTIDSLISETVSSISLLKEHRTALISAAVTGKIDVRGMVDTKEGAA